MPADQAISRLLASLSGRHRAWAAARATAGLGIVLAVALCLLDLLWPRWVPAAALAAAATLVGAAVVGALRGRLPLAAADRALGLGDRLLTHVDVQRRGEGRGAFARWLTADLERDVAALPRERLSRVWRRPLGALRYLIPALVLLLLLRWLAPLPPTTAADRGQPLPSQGSPSTGSGGETASGDAPAPSAGGEEPQEEPRPEPFRPDPGASRQAPLPEPPPAAAQHQPPPPLLERPTIDLLVVPQFIGEGASRRAVAPQALLEVGPPPPASASAPAARPAPTPEQQPEDEYERAVERALRARHVPPVERAFVARYFERLAEAGR